MQQYVLKITSIEKKLFGEKTVVKYQRAGYNEDEAQRKALQARRRPEVLSAEVEKRNK